MDKQTFLSTLRSGLDFLPAQERDEVVAEFEEHFEVGVERGHSEEALLDQLGDPTRVIEAYRVDAMRQGNVSPAEKEKPHAQPRPIERMPQTSSNRYVSIHEKHRASAVKKVTIRVIDSNVIFVPGEDGVSVDIEGNCGCDYTVHLSDGELLINQESRFLRFLHWGKEPDVRLTLPAAFKGLVDVKSTAGDLFIPSFKAKELRANTVSGDFQLGELYIAGNARINSISGDIKGGRVMADELVIRSTSGDVKLSSITAEKLNFQTVSGDIDTKITDSWKEMHFQSVSGDVKLRLAENGAPFDVKLTSMSGRVKSELPCVSGTGRAIHAQSVSGDVKIKRF